MTSDASHKQGRIMILATAGHVDHGKTSLVRQLTGFDTDTLEEEKRRGLTINLGFAYHEFSLPENSSYRHTLGFVDVPGHIDFINNMLAGVSSVDASLLTIAADDGIMPQTREHLAILQLLGIPLCAIVINKVDRGDEDRLASLEGDIDALLTEHGYTAVPRFHVSATNGTGIDELREFLQLQVSSKAEYDPASEMENFRFLVDRSFSVKGIGTVVTGSVNSGCINTGASLTHSASGESCRIKGMRLHESEIQLLHPGTRAALNINLPWSAVCRGDWLLDGNPPKPCLRFDARLQILDQTMALNSGAEYHLHTGANHYVVNLRWLDQETSLAQIKSNSPIHTCFGDRFIIRDPAATRTLGGGHVLDVHVPRRGRATAERLAYLQALDADLLHAIRALLPGLACGLNMDQFLQGRNKRREFFPLLCKQLESESVPFTMLKVRLAELPWLMDRDVFTGHRQTILRQLTDFHQKQPAQKGISEASLSRVIEFPGSHLLLNAIVSRLLESGDVSLSGTYLHLPQHRASLSETEKRFLNTIRPILEKAGRLPPRTRELVEQSGIALGPLEKILKQATSNGHLVQIAENRYFLPETVVELAALAESLASDSESDEGFTVISFRDESGLGRNLCIEILEYFDNVGFTRRDGNQRFVRTSKENIFAGNS